MKNLWNHVGHSVKSPVKHNASLDLWVQTVLGLGSLVKFESRSVFQHLLDLQFDWKDVKSEQEGRRMHWWDFWMHKVFWIRWLPLMFTLVLFTLGIAFFTAKRALTVAYFQASLFFKCYPKCFIPEEHLSPSIKRQSQ